MNYFKSYIFLLFVLKIIFILLASINLYLKIKGKESNELYKTSYYWKGRVEFIFTIFMALFMIYLFNPRINRIYMINGETKILLYLFGIVLLVTADWSNFIDESIWLKRIQTIVG
jgi:hypothetical protein